MHTVLIVDDDIDDVELTTLSLEVTGRNIIVKSVLSGAAAMKLLRNRGCCPDLILLDLKMSGMNGVETLREIRADADTKGIPVIIVTSSTLESDLEDANSAGADGFVHKAFDSAQFNKEIKSALDRWLLG
jgi:two-component system response regulator